MEKRLPALQRLARLSQARSFAALPPLRILERVPQACPLSCGNLDIAPMGRSTERLEEQLAGLLIRPDGSPVRIARIDADSTRGKGALEAQLGAVHAGDVDMLMGTQMITRGLIFLAYPRWSRRSTPTSLFSSDFRAPERLFRHC